MLQSKLKNEITDVDSLPAGSPPNLVDDVSGSESDSDSSISTDADGIDKPTMASKKSSKKASGSLNDSSILNYAYIDEEPRVGKKPSKKASKKSSKKANDRVFDNIDYSVSLDPFGSGSNDPFAKDKKESEMPAMSIHIRLQQRNARKWATTLQGLPEEFDLKKLGRHFMKTYGCLGTVVNDPKHGKVIQLGGDQRMKLSQFLIDEGIAKKGDIMVHGC